MKKRFYRLLKPEWAKEFRDNGDPNPKFVRNIEGPKINAIEGYGFDKEYLDQMNKNGWGIHHFPNHPNNENLYKPDKRYINGKDVDVFKFVYVDMDLKDGEYETKEAFYQELNRFALPPTLVVDSGNGVHAYWSVTDLTRDVFVRTQQAMLRWLKTDEAIYTPMRTMRLPMSLNTKDPSNFKLVEIITKLSSKKDYLVSDFPQEIYDNLREEDEERVTRHLNRLDGVISTQLGSLEGVDFSVLPDSFLDLLTTDDKVSTAFTDPSSYGDRSRADMILAHYLFTAGFSIKEALQVIANTQKALEKGSARFDYAKLTVDKVFESRPSHKFETAAQLVNQNIHDFSDLYVHGPSYLDGNKLGVKWKKTECLGIISGSGMGKTSFALNMLKAFIDNNADNDDVYVFFSLEMPKADVIAKWVAITDNDPELANRLYVSDTQDDEGLPVQCGLQDIYSYCKELKQVMGVEIGAIIVDHFHLISTHIDMESKAPKFGIESAPHAGSGRMRSLDLNGVARGIKALSKTLKIFTIVLTQTTKEKGIGDVPLFKEACHGVSDYEWIMDRIITLWQPLMRVPDETPLRFTAYQYAKIRATTIDDKILPLQQKLLTFDRRTETFTPTNRSEYDEFALVLPLAIEARKQAQTNTSQNYVTDF